MLSLIIFHLRYDIIWCDIIIINVRTAVAAFVFPPSHIALHCVDVLLYRFWQINRV